MPLWILAALTAALLAGALALVLARARSLRERHRAVLGTALPALDERRERLVDALRALYHGTRFSDGSALLSPGWRTACAGDLWCTDEAVFFRREADAPRSDEGGPASGGTLAFPLAWIEDASLVRAHAPIAGKDLPMLRLRWKRGGQVLVSDFSLRGGIANLERLRREIHLRQGRDSALAALGPLLQKTPAPGSGAGGPT